MLLGGREIQLFRDHFVLNVALPAEVGGLSATRRDPRKFRKKPDAYDGVVEEVGSGCRFVKPGDRVVIERWTYEQMDVDDERLVARERDLLVLADGKPAPGAIAIRPIERPKPTTTLIVPETITEPEVQSYCGIVTSSAHSVAKEGDKVWIEKRDIGQFRAPDGQMVFRVDQAVVLAKEEA